jgi:transposase
VPGRELAKLPGTRYNGGMIETVLPPVPERRPPLPTPAHALLEQVATLRRENAALRAENAILHERIRELEARLGQNSSNSSHPPSSDPPQAPTRPQAPPSGRKRGGQPGHPGVYRALLPIEQVNEVREIGPEICRHCRQPFPDTVARGHGRVWRHQVVELLPLAVRVTEYQMAVRRCAACRKRTRASLPPGVPRRPFGLRLTAVIALLSGRYRLSRREVRQLLQDLWAVRVSLGAIVRQEQAVSIALVPVVEEVQVAIQQTAVVNMDETGWRQERKRAWLWTVVAAELTVFRIDSSGPSRLICRVAATRNGYRPPEISSSDRQIMRGGLLVGVRLQWKRCWVPSTAGWSDRIAGPPTSGSPRSGALCAGRT